MLRLVLLAATACVAYRIVRENIPVIPRDFDLPGGSPPAPARATGRSAGPAATRTARQSPGQAAKQAGGPAATPVAGVDDAAATG